MRNVLILLISFLVLTGCQYDNGQQINVNNSNDENEYVAQYNDKYFFNLTEGIFMMSKNFINPQQIICDYCFFPVFKGDTLYYIGNCGASVESLNVENGEHNTVYCSENGEIVYFTITQEECILIEGEQLVSIDFERTLISKIDIDHSYAFCSNDEFLLYTTSNNRRLMAYDYKSKAIKKVFEIDNGRIGETIEIDTDSIYFVLRTAEGNQLCKYNLNNKTIETIIKDEFGEDFVIKGNTCYYSFYPDDSQCYLNMFDFETKETKKLLCTDYEINGIGFFDNKLIYRRGGYGKQLEILNLNDNTTYYLYEDIIKQITDMGDTIKYPNC